jgi:hypothetical protein
MGSGRAERAESGRLNSSMNLITDGPEEMMMLTEHISLLFCLHVVHRQRTTLAFLIRLSPSYEEQLVPLLGEELLKGKLEVREVADRLCSA